MLICKCGLTTTFKFILDEKNHQNFIQHCFVRVLNKLDKANIKFLHSNETI